MQKSFDIFTAVPQSVYNLICEQNNKGFYLPAYQRPYAWEEKNIEDLFRDFDSVFRNLLESSSAIIFLGSVLTVDAYKANAVEPKPDRNTPNIINIIIDGQQRLTTLILITVCINERLRGYESLLKKLAEKEENELVSELKEVLLQLIKDTSNFVLETTADHPTYKYLPRIIRAQEDLWGKDEKIAKYASPIPEFLVAYRKYITNFQTDSRTGSVFKEFDLKELKYSTKNVIDNIKLIRKSLSQIEDGFNISFSKDDDDSVSIQLEDLIGNENLKECLDFTLDEQLLDLAKEQKGINRLIFLILFTKFYIHRVCLTYVEVNNEAYAFDMFEALNTTGEPLTAIETFVPKVYDFISQKKKRSDESHVDTLKLLNQITDRFEPNLTADEKNKLTKSLIIAFIRAYKGRVNVKTLRNQRDELIKTFGECKDHNKDDYLHYLNKSAFFLTECWNNPNPQLEKLVAAEDLDLARLCLSYLVEINHIIVQSLLIQFLLLDEKYELSHSPNNNFITALKAITALSVLWRAMSGGADGIDKVYKDLHERGMELSNGKIGPFQLNTLDLQEAFFNSDNLKKYFYHALEVKITTKKSVKLDIEEQWIDVCANQQTYDNTKTLKMLLLASYHGLKKDDSGFNRVNESSTNFLNKGMWDLLSKKNVIKLVYSREYKGEWVDELKDPLVFNKLGNIFVDYKNRIAPSSSVTWETIRTNMLSELKENSLINIDETVIIDSIENDIYLKNRLILRLDNKYTDITHFDTWNKQAIEERTELMFKNIWANLIEWLR